MESDRNLLFGLAAIQSGLIDASQLVQAGIDWLARRDRPLVDVIEARGWISGEGRSTLEALVRDLERSTLDAGAETVTRSHSPGDFPCSSKSDGGDHSTFAWMPVSGADEHLPRSADSIFLFGRRYVDLRVHATGGIGRIWRATDSVLRREVALKEIRTDRLSLPAIGRRFLEEARITSKLEHPNIIPVHDLSERSARPYYTMRFLGDSTLQSAVRDYYRKDVPDASRGPKFRGLLEAFVAVCNAIAFAHSKGVIHRDLKGQNVILGEFGEVIVLDWGLAKRLDTPDDPLAEPVPDAPVGPDCSMGGTTPGQAIGTPNYMPPEQAAGELDRVDQRSDVFGLGAMLYLILTGRPPYEGGDFRDVIRKAIEAKPDPPRAVNPKAPAALEAVCLKALGKNPGDRYASAKELAEEVGRWLADEPVTAHPEGRVTRLNRWSRKNRPIVASAMALLLTALIASVISTLLLKREQDKTFNEQKRTLVMLDRSNQNVIYARRAVDKMLVEVATTDLPTLPHTLRMRQRVAAEAGEIYQRLVSENPGDPKVARSGAVAMREVGGIHRMLLEFNPAAGAYDKALRWLTRSGEAQDGDLLANILIDSGGVEASRSRFQLAEFKFYAARTIAKNLEEESLEAPNPRRLEARSLVHIGEICLVTGRPAQALEHVEQALGILRPLADGRDRHPLDRLEMVQDLCVLGMILREQGRGREAEAAIDEAARRIQPVETNNDRFLLALTSLERGHLLAADPSRASEVETVLTPPIESIRQLSGEFPEFGSYRVALSDALYLRSVARLEQGISRLADAESDANQSLHLIDEIRVKSPQLEGLHGRFGRTLRQLGRISARRKQPGASGFFERAEQEFRRALEINEKSRSDRIDLEAIRADREKAATRPGDGRSGPRSQASS